MHIKDEKHCINYTKIITIQSHISSQQTAQYAEKEMDSTGVLSHS